jgi:hypothetical protein
LKIHHLAILTITFMADVAVAEVMPFSSSSKLPNAKMSKFKL